MVMDFFAEYWLVISFYVGVSLLVYFNRDKFEFQGKVIALYKTKLGINAMKMIARKFPRSVKTFGTLSIWAGFAGMVLIVSMIVYGVYQLIFEPSAPAMFTPVIPGFNIPGGIYLPLVEGLLALFIVIVVHEFSHGMVSKVYNIPIKSSGFVMFGPIPGAFVEPEEEKLEKASDKVKLSILGAGPFSNVVLFTLLFLVALGGAWFISDAYQAGGLTVNDFTEEPIPGLNSGDTIISFDGEEIGLLSDLQDSLDETTPGQQVTLGLQDREVDIELRTNPVNESRSWIGVTLAQVVVPANGNSFLEFIQAPLFWLFGTPYALSLTEALGLIQWIFILSLGIGLVNLLPVGPVDGGRMFLIAMKRYIREDLAKSIWVWTSKVLFVTLILLVLVPIIRALL